MKEQLFPGQVDRAPPPISRRRIGTTPSRSSGLEKITFDLGETLMTPAAIKKMMEELAKKRDR